MALRHAVRAVSWAFACSSFAGLLGAGFGRRGALLGVALIALATVGLLLWLPRFAHAAFATGRHASAARRYRLLAAFAWSARRERAARLSRAAADLAAGDLDLAERQLARFEPAALDAAERVTWLNNRAYLALLAGRDPGSALALIEEAIALRPDVPAVQHTRATALIALGRADEAITVLEAMRAGGDLAPALEAQRCRELARAWEQKGQLDYAADYRERARWIAR